MIGSAHNHVAKNDTSRVRKTIALITLTGYASKTGTIGRPTATEDKNKSAATGKRIQKNFASISTTITRSTLKSTVNITNDIESK